MYNEVYEKYKKEVVACICLVFACMIVYAAAQSISHIGKLKVEVHAVPGDASVTLNNQPVSNGDVYIAAGTYTVVVKKDGFETMKSSSDITPNKQQNVIAASLTPVSDAAKKWSTDHQNDYKDNEYYGGVEAKQTGEYTIGRYPIINALPYEDPYYKIAYRSTDDNRIVVTIDTPSPRYRYEAIAKIRSLGYDPADYQIDFRDYKNPLETH